MTMAELEQRLALSDTIFNLELLDAKKAAQLQRARSRGAQMRACIEDLQAQLAAAAGENSSLRREKEAMLAEIAQLRARHELDQRRLQDLDATKQSLRAEVQKREEAEGQVEVLRADVGAKMRAVEGLRKDLDAAVVLLEEFKEQRRGLLRRNDLLDAKATDLAAELQSLNSKLNESLARAELVGAENSRLAAAFDDATAQLAAMAAERAAHVAAVGSLSADLKVTPPPLRAVV